MPDEINAAGAKPGSRLRELGLVLPKPLCPNFSAPRWDTSASCTVCSARLSAHRSWSRPYLKSNRLSLRPAFSIRSPRTDASITNVGAVLKPLEVPAFSLILGQKSVNDSYINGYPDRVAMISGRVKHLSEPIPTGCSIELPSQDVLIRHGGI
jgi:hypothetical protein